MKRTRNRYHFAIRKVKSEESELRKSNILSQCLDGKIDDVLKSLKSQRKNKQSSNVVDGASDDKSIANVFKNIYSNIYNVHKDGDSVNEILNNLEKEILPSDMQLVDKITPELVKKIICGLKRGKNDVNYCWQSDALINGIVHLAEPLADLFRAYVVHGFVPDIFLLCALTLVLSIFPLLYNY